MGPLINRSVVQNAYVVNDLQEAMDRWTKVFNVGPWLVIPVVEAEDMRYYGEPTDLKMAVAMGQAGDVQVELIQPLNDVPSVYRDLFPKGKEGHHHVAIFADDYDAEIARYESLGFKLGFSGKAGDMRFGYMDTSPALGIMVEVLENTPGIHQTFDMVKAAGADWDGKELLINR